MERLYIESKTFEKADIPDMGLALGDYEDCTFNSCDLSNLNLSGLHFTECEFFGCNMSMVKLAKTTFNDVKFTECKLVALHFEDCNEFLFSVSFDQCQLTLSSFYKRKLKNTIFKNSTLLEVDFTEADLTGSVFDHCDLAMATFENTILEKADFRTSFHYTINPELNRIKKARFSMAGIAGLLSKYDIEVE